MTSIKLNFINNSNDTNNSQIVIFQKNTAPAAPEDMHVAWKVIENCGKGWNHPFSFPVQVTVAVTDSYGNLSPQQPATEGQQLSVTLGPSGDTLKPSGKAEAPSAIEIVNGLTKGAINANIYRGGALLATTFGLKVGHKTAFAFRPILCMGVVSQMEQGEVMNAAMVETLNTEISLMGIQSADIVMTGGGPGPVSTPFSFTLQNIKYA